MSTFFHPPQGDGMLNLSTKPKSHAQPKIPTESAEAKKEEQIALKLHKRTLFAACEKGPFIFQMLREMRCKR
jgi:hypothetical protein